MTACDGGLGLHGTMSSLVLWYVLNQRIELIYLLLLLVLLDFAFILGVISKLFRWNEHVLGARKRIETTTGAYDGRFSTLHLLYNELATRSQERVLRS